MPKRTLRDRNSIENLGHYAQKRFRVPSRQPARSRGTGDKENVLPLASEVCFPAQLGIECCCLTEYFTAALTFVSTGYGSPSSAQALSPSPEVRMRQELDEQGAEASSQSSPSDSPVLPTSSFVPPPSMEEARSALHDLKTLIRPPRKCRRGSGHFTTGDDRLLSHLWQMQMFLSDYVSSGNTKQWGALSLETAQRWQKGTHTARSLRAWTRAFLKDRHDLPLTPENTWTRSLLDKCPDLKVAVSEHLQSIGKYVRALDIVQFTAMPANLTKYGLAKPISLSQAQVWMRALDYRWTKTPNGQFVDGHERADVTSYRQTKFLPAIADYDHHARQWDKDGTEVPVPDDLPRPRNRRVVYWHHDESVFYAHNRRVRRWVHKTEKAVPRAKGEGASLMVADFVSAEYGWLRSPDGKESAQVLFCPGKNRDGYFTHEEILTHATTAMDILSRHYPNEQHVFIFDNAPTHLKRAPDALSARKMSLYPTKPGGPFFGVEQTTTDAGGKEVKVKVPMANGHFNGQPQSFYFETGHPRAGIFKGMAQILTERGYDLTGLLRECPGFKCKPPTLSCCIRQLLFNSRIFRRLRHCSRPTVVLAALMCCICPNSICWGYAKRKYREMPASSKEADLEANVLAALNSIPLVTIRRFYTRAHRFMDAYRRGLDGKQAAWAAKKYRSHRVLPNDILEELDREGITPDN
ncbi:hypothetical protein BD309DRAFT_982699 [Dichomitus squalens]|nr:hypothetical protein BD309DRAFT_982699 [Dichomitus squalens]